MATGTFPLAVTAVALGRVGDLMQEQHALSESVNVARLGQEMTSAMSTPKVLPATVKHQVIAGFTQAAARYDEGGTEFFEDMGCHLVDLAGVKPGAHVLDAGCGKGAVTIPAARLAGEHGQSTPSTWPSRCYRPRRPGPARAGWATSPLRAATPKTRRFRPGPST